MYDLHLSKSRRARVWLGELAPALFTCERIHQRSISLSDANSDHCVQIPSTIAAVELWVPIGPILYALLGGQFSSSTDRILKVEICISEREDLLYKETISHDDDTVYVGLPEEFAQGAIEGINYAVASEIFPCGGTLHLNCAAQSRYGSSHVLFSQAALILAKLLIIAQRNPSQDDLARCFPANIWSRLPQ